MSKPLVAYYRVSTREQSKSGLGIDAQRAAVARFAEAEGFEIASEFTEVETGKGADALDRRPQLAAALVEARRQGKAPVVVAKLDRLSRDVHFISGHGAQDAVPRRRAGAGRRAVPAASLCRPGRERARPHPQRTKAALAAAKARGQSLGNPRLADARAIPHAASRAGADAHADTVLPAIREVQDAGAKSLREIAAALNARGIATARGGKWEATTVRNVLRRASP
jgi:DNA invertase Pin-like site-specific DNA recombinase